MHHGDIALGVVVGSGMWLWIGILVIGRWRSMEPYFSYYHRFSFMMRENVNFSVRSFYQFLVGNMWNRRDYFLATQIWKTLAPQRIAFFAWETGRECILTIDKLMKRSRTVVHGCYLCKRTAETCNHILLWCPLAYEMWTIVYNLLGINWVIAGSVREEL